jgi:hypothetical protein
MGPTLRRVVSAATSALVVLSITMLSVAAGADVTAAAPLTDQQRSERAVSYLAGQQRPSGAIVAFSPVGSTADAVLAFVAAGIGREQMNAALGFLRRQVVAGKVTDLGLQAKVALAVTAANRDPRSFGGTNLVQSIRTQLASDGHFGSSAVFDDALAVLAIESAGLTPALRAATWLLEAQCPDGGWAYDKPYDSSTDDADCFDGTGTDYFTADTNTTSYVVQALIGMQATDWPGTTPFQFFKAVRTGSTGGWPYSAGFDADANSTALVLQAYASAALASPPGSLIALRKFQNAACGAFAFNVGGPADVGASIGAVPGLQRKALPFTGTVRAGLVPVTACS